MKGVARKSWRQEPGEERDWPPPSAPAAVCCRGNLIRIVLYKLYLPWRSCSPARWTASQRDSRVCSCLDCALRSRSSEPHRPHTWETRRLVGQSLARPGDELRDRVLCHRHHGNRLVGGEPVRLVVTAGVVTDVIEVTEEEGHRVKLVDTGPRHACNSSRGRSG